METAIIEKLKTYFEGRDDVVLAFLFGSSAKGAMTDESDVDVAVYFAPKGARLEWEANRELPERGSLWGDVEKIAGRRVDLIVLNNASASIAASALSQGIPLAVRNKSLYWRLYLTVSAVAEDFRSFVEDYWKIKERSRSLSAEDRERLIHTADFLKSELSDIGKFEKLDQRSYQTDSSRRRDIERWAENLVNASIDIAKILLASEKQKIPRTYKEVLVNLSFLPGFDQQTAASLAEFADLRNFLAHEYLDLRFKELHAFLKKADALYAYLFNFVRTLLQHREKDTR